MRPYRLMKLNIQLFNVIWQKGQRSKPLRDILEVSLIQLIHRRDGRIFTEHSQLDATCHSAGAAQRLGGGALALSHPHCI